jgi:hypothetical protein
MSDKKWKEQARCLNFDTNLFFEDYEEDVELRKDIDELCAECPVVRQCFAVGISNKGWGVWGGVYMENGKISREFNRHRTKADWAEKWSNLTMDKDK